MRASTALRDVGALLQGVLSNNQVAQGGLTLMVLGATAATARHLLSIAAEAARRRMFVRMEVDSRDDAYRWIMAWMSRHPEFANHPRVSVTTSLQAFGTSALEGSLVGSRKVLLLPSPGEHLMSYKGRWLWISRQRLSGGANAPFNGRVLAETLVLSTWGTDRHVLEDLLSECATAYEADTRQRTIVHSMDSDGFWTRVGSRPIRPLSTVVLPGNQAEGLLADCQEFLQSEAWYARHGIPYRRGYLLYGVPGSGKTSLVTALAGALALDVYVVTLSSPAMTDETLRQLLNNAEAKSLLLLEDVDAAFRGREGQQAGSSLTFSGLLNAIDGVAAQEGRLLFMTTNHIDKLSSALIRPGRVDVRCFFGWATREQMARMFIAFFRDAPPATAGAADVPEAAAAAELTHSPTTLAASSDPPAAPEAQPGVLPRDAGGTEPKGAGEGELAQLAQRFAGSVPEQLVSMAGVQGFLMRHKHSPRRALEGVEAWVQELQQQAAAASSGSGGTAAPARGHDRKMKEDG